MFGSSYWYVGPAPDGRRFCWSKVPTFTCPVHEDAAELRRDEPPPGAGLQIHAAAALLAVDARWLAMRVAGASHGRRREPGENGKLTSICMCGHRMERKGFAYWTEREAERDDVGAQITRAMGSTPVERLDATHYAETKREAEAWAREQLQVARL